MMKKYFPLVALVVILILARVQLIAATAESHVNTSTIESHIDTSAIEMWCGDFSSGNIRMVGAWVAGYEGNNVLIEDETGNIWMMDDCYIDKDEFLLLWLADNDTPSNVEDDLIIKVWTELH